MASDPEWAARSRAADQRDLAADARDELADRRDAAADRRDEEADRRDEEAAARDRNADAREARLREQEAEVATRARRLGLATDAVPGGTPTAGPGTADASLGEAFARLTEQLYDEQTAERLLARIATEPGALDEIAQDIGFVLAGHAALASRSDGEVARLERLVERLERALMSRDVIGQAKGILMERLKTTPEGAFELLTRSSQALNVKLREVARTLTETGQVKPERILGP